jgi:hypothetical protein
MENHIVILATPKRKITEIGLKILLETLITKNLTKLEYFGFPIDNQADYIDDEMQEEINSTSYIEIYFESEYGIDYEDFNYNDVNDLVLQHLNKSKNLEVVAVGKDVTIYT